MEFLELAAQRESCRKYQDTPVEREKIMNCFEAARIGPSACNSQPYRFILLDDKEKVAKMGDYLQLGPINKFTHAVPAFIIIVDQVQKLLDAVEGKEQAKYMLGYDIGIAAQNICLAATSQGLGTCIMGMFNEPEIKKMLNIPEERRVALVIAVGYPVHPLPRGKVRRNLDDIVGINEY